MKLLAAVSVALTVFLLACSSTEADWQKANSANTVAAYQDFLKEHPNGQHADEARTKIHSLQDEQAWTDATNTNTEAGFQNYVKGQPNGSHVQEAQDKITGFERAAAWQTASADGSAAALQAFLEKYPSGPEADQAKAQLQKLNSQYRVQLAGSYRSAKLAERAGKRLKAKYGDLLHDVVVIPPAAGSKSSHLQSAPMSEDEANTACAKLKKAHQHCEVVKS